MPARRDVLRGRFAAIVFTLLIAASVCARGAELRIGLGPLAPIVLDPHFFNLTPNNAITEQIYEPLVRRNASFAPVPALAESWRYLGDLTWEFKLRRGVKFHNGADFTAADVEFSLKRPDRLGALPNPPAFGVRTYTQAIARIEVIDAYTIRLTQAKPYAYLLDDLAGVMIVSRGAVEAKGNVTERFGNAFDSPAVAQGTAALRVDRFVRGDRLILKRHDAYWGEKPAWDTVTFSLIESDPTRFASLTSGAIDLIENLSPDDYAKAAKDRNLEIFETTSNRIVHLQLDVHRDESPYVSDKAGRRLVRNPFKDRRVRAAISHAINREAIVERLLEGRGAAAGQMMPVGPVAWSPDLKPDPYKPDTAKRLLAEAGYPNGFRFSLHAANDRFVKGTQVVQAIAQNLARVGIDVNVISIPYNTYINLAKKFDVSAVVQSWSAVSEGTIPLRFVALTRSADGLGDFNYGRYSNPQVDALYREALRTLDTSRRHGLLQRATELVIRDYGIIPLYFQSNIWAARRPLKYSARRDERTYAHEVRLAR